MGRLMERRTFKEGERYTIFAGSARFKALVVSRTRRTVTFEIPEKFECWLLGKLYPEGGMTVTLRLSDKGPTDSEYVSGAKNKWFRKCRLESWAD